MRLDDRVFKREQYSYFNLANKLPGINDAVEEWWEREWELSQQARAFDQKRQRDRPSSLDQVLVDYKLSKESKARVLNRMKRGGIDMSKHRGDPDTKRFFLECRKHGLLDEHGNPVPTARQDLEEIENEKRAKRGERETREHIR
jgi:hypothetical protein